jgi:hypothetical protein
MPKTALDDAVADLRKYYQLFSLEELVSSDLLLNVLPNEDDPPLLLKELSSLVVETQRGSLISPSLVKKITALDLSLGAGKTNKVVRAIYEPEFTFASGESIGIKEILGSSNDEGINSTPNNPSKNNTSLSVYQVMTSRISPSNKNANALSVFLSAIPTLEWSRAIPYLTVKFQFQRPAISATGRASTLSSVKFLNGATSLYSNGPLNGSFDLKMQTAVSRDTEFALAGDNNSDGFGEAGMELFLMPQTLINANTSDASSARVVPVLDKFRPLASLKSFDVDVAPAAGLMSHRTAKLAFTLHDQTRLHEIADFIKPGLYNVTEMLIEYGWEHPDKSGNNVFGNFLNALRVKEKYAVSNYDLGFRPNGEVDVSLSLYTKGAVDMYTSKVGQSAKVEDTQKIINKLQERISELRQSIFKNDNLTKEIRGQQILSTAGDQNSNLQLSRKLQRELEKTLVNLSDNPSHDAKELRDSLIDLYGTDGTNGAARDIGIVIGKAIDDKISVIKGRSVKQGGKRTPDPFLETEFLKNRLVGGDKFEQFVSLAKIMTLFIGQPLAALKKFDDIQFVYYTLNDNAGFGKGMNIGSFPIVISDFQKRYKKLATLRRTSNLALREFMSFLSNTFLEDISNPTYGLRDLYSYEPDKETGKRNIPKREFRNNPTKLNNEIEERMKEAGVPDGRFKLPQIDMYVECVPGAPDSEGKPKSLFDGYTVLRIHIFDKFASAYQSQGEFLAAQRNNSISTLGQFVSEARAGVDPEAPLVLDGDDKSQLKKLIQKAVGRNYIRRIMPVDGKGDPEAQVYRFVAGANQIKSFIANTMPTYFHGMNNSAVLDAGFKTMQDQKLSTINMITTGDRGDLSPEGAATSGLPIRVFPAQADMRMMGCPIFEFTQNLFCDLRTGTSIDNIYAATKIQHSIKPGSFQTSCFLTPIGDAYGQYNSLLQNVKSAISILSEFDDTDGGQTGS